MLAFIILGFALLMLPQWQQFLDKENTTLIFLNLVLASILFLNTLIERGSSKLPTWAQIIFSAQILLLPILTSLAIYAIFLCVQQYGFSPSRFISLLLSLAVLAYTLAYALQLLRLRRNWSEGFKQVNPPLALVTALVAALTLTPVLDPQAWSVRNQLARLQEGHVTAQQFDYNSLLNKLGRPGVEAAIAMQQWKDHPQYAAIIKGIETEKSINAKSSTNAEQALTKLKVIPTTQAVDLNAFAKQAQRIFFNMTTSDVTSCYRILEHNVECLLVFQDVNGDAEEEALLLKFTQPLETDTTAKYQIDSLFYLLDHQGLPIRAKNLTNAAVKFELDANANFSEEYHYPALGKASFEQIKAAAETRQLTPALPALPDLVIGGQTLKQH